MRLPAHFPLDDFDKIPSGRPFARGRLSRFGVIRIGFCAHDPYIMGCLNGLSCARFPLE